jgi:hypothetical protein
MVTGGGGQGGRTADPFEAVGLESLMRINDRMSANPRPAKVSNGKAATKDEE